MRASVVAALLLAAAACGKRAPGLYAAGTTADDGHGELARASAQFLTDEPQPDAATSASQMTPRRPDAAVAPSGTAAAGADSSGLGEDGDGSATYASYVVPPWPPQHVDRRPKYSPADGLSGAIEGVITWRGAMPAAVATSCGAIPPLAADAGRALSNVLVYIEKVPIGRTLPNDGKPASVGGLVVKRGCTLAPFVQIATPLPASVLVYGDATSTQVRVTPPSGSSHTHALQAGGRVALPVEAGVTRIDADDGSFASAWIIAVDTPYYALTDEHGRFRLDELAPGNYDVTIWHAPTASVTRGVLAYGPPLVVQRSVRVAASKTARLDVALSR